jgi:hypothetical protein
MAREPHDASRLAEEGEAANIKFPSTQHSYPIPAIEVWYMYNFQDTNSCWRGNEHENHIILMDGTQKQWKHVTRRLAILTIHSNKALSTFRTPALLFRLFWLLLHEQRIEVRPTSDI